MSVRVRITMRAQLVAVVALLAACGLFRDAAVDLASCINRAADGMPGAQRATWDADCRVRNRRVVTAVLLPRELVANPTDSASVAILRQLGLPNDAIFYNGPDTPSIGRPVSLVSVYVYDGAYSDNRRYSVTNSLRSDIRIVQPMAMTGDHFRVELGRSPGGVVEVRALR